MTRAYIYARVSPKPKPDDTSVDRQIELCEALAAANGVEVVRVYADRLVSASKTAPRPQFERMLAEIGELNIGDVIYAWHPDRVYRRMEDLLRLTRALRVGGDGDQCRTLHTVETGPLDLSKPSGVLNAEIHAALAKSETAHKSRRVRVKHDSLTREGRSAGGGRAFGFKRGNHEVDPAEAAVLVEVVERYLAGAAINGLAKELTARGVLTPRGNAWSNTTLREVLRNPRIAGIRTATPRALAADDETVVRGKRVEVRTATWEPIISETTFRRVEAMLARTAKDRGRPPRVFTGLLTCGRCGAKLVANKRAAQHGGHPIYSCHRPKGQGAPGCHGNSIRADLLEPRLEAALVRYARTYRPPAVTVDTTAADAELAAVAAARATVGRMVVAGTMHEDAAAAAEVDLRAREAQARGVLRAAVEATQGAHLPAGAGELAELWHGWDNHAKRLAAPDYIAEVVVQAFNPARKGWDPERVWVRFHGQEELTPVA